MKKFIFALIVLNFSCYFGYSQIASDILENGKSINKDEKVFLSFDNNFLYSDIKVSEQGFKSKLNFTLLEDSVIFLTSRTGLNLYLQPLNPLNFSYSDSVFLKLDNINHDASKALETIIDLTDLLARSQVSKSQMGRRVEESITVVLDTCEGFSDIKEKLLKIQTLLKDDKKSIIITLFKGLKALDFSDYLETKSKFDTIDFGIEKVKTHFIIIDTLLNQSNRSISKYQCSSKHDFDTKYIFNLILKDLNTTYKEQRKRIENLNLARNMVEQAIIKANYEKLWFYHLDTISVKNDSISSYTLRIKKSGLELNKENEIVSIQPISVLTKNVRVRKYRLFVPEVVLGTTFTFFKYNSYGTYSDSSGKQHVSTPKNEIMRNLNISTMINWNLYTEDSPLHFLYQVGIGVNYGMPTLLTGVGVRSNFNGTRRFAISVGCALTAIKELDKLKVGDVVTSTKDIEDDLKLQLAWPPKLYIGLQYKF